MQIKRILMATAAIAATALAMPAGAAPLLFELTGSRTATFTLDSNPAPDFASSSFIGDQIRFDNVAGTFGGTPGTASIGFGTGLVAGFQILSPSLGFTQFVSPPIFTGGASDPMFSPGTFNLTSIVSGSSTLRISAITAAVPEPATWAMMVAGFGMVGAGLRHRRRRVAVAFG